MEIKLTFEEHGFKGHVIMNVAKNSQRLRLMGALGISVSDLTTEKIKDVFEDFEVIANMIDSSEKFYKTVSLKKDGKEYKSFKDLDSDSACQQVQVECAQKTLLGIGGKTGKKSKS